MLWLIFLYILPGIIVTWLLPQFINYQGGTEYLKYKWGDDWNDDYYGYVIAIASFCPILNIFWGSTLLIWYVYETFN